MSMPSGDTFATDEDDRDLAEDMLMDYWLRDATMIILQRCEVNLIYKSGSTKSYA